jgi:hypothetical protein
VKQRRLTALGESNDSYFHANDYARIGGDGQAREAWQEVRFLPVWFEITLNLCPFTVPQLLAPIPGLSYNGFMLGVAAMTNPGRISTLVVD